MPRYLDPKNDLMFKKVFGEHKNLCISLLNSLLKLENDKQISDIEYGAGELLPDLPPSGKYGRLIDVRCRDLIGRQFVVEIQLLWTNWFQTRVLFNANKAYVKPFKNGIEYVLTQPSYSLNFVDDIFDKDTKTKDVFYHHYKIVNIENTEKQIKGLEFVFVELPKYKPSGLKEQDYFDLWLRFLTEISNESESVPPDLLETEELREAVQCVLESSLTEAERDTYDRVRDAQMTQRTLIKGTRHDALEEGIQLGIQKLADLLNQGVPLPEAMKKLGLN